MKKHFILMSFSVLFLANPVFGIADFVPDFLGYILLFMGLSGLSELEENLAFAKKGFLTLAFVSAGKAFLQMTFPGLTSMTKLLLSFSFAVVECIFFLPAARGLYSGLDYLSARHSDRGDKGAKPQKLCGITYAFFFAKAFASFAPLLPTLSVSGAGNGGTFVFGNGETVWSQFTNLYYLFGVILTLALAVPWAVRFVKVNLALCADREFMSKISAKYEKEVLAFPDRISARRLKYAMLLFVVSCGFSADFYIDHVNVLPGFIGSALLFAAVLCLGDSPKVFRVSCAAASALRTVVSYVGLSLQRNFVKEGYNPERALHNIGNSAEMYKKIEVLSFAEGFLYGLCAVLFMICLLKSLRYYEKRLPRVADAVRSVRVRLIFVDVLLAFSVIIDALKDFAAKYVPAFYLATVASAVLLALFAYRAYLEATDNLGNRMSL